MHADDDLTGSRQPEPDSLIALKPLEYQVIFDNAMVGIVYTAASAIN